MGKRQVSANPLLSDVFFHEAYLQWMGGLRFEEPPWGGVSLAALDLESLSKMCLQEGMFRSPAEMVSVRWYTRQNRWVMVEISDKTWSTAEGNDKTTLVFLP